MGQQNIVTGGMQYVPQMAIQYVYLDFDGEITSYNGEALTVNHVEVIDSKLTAERISGIVSALNEKYASQNVIFVTERPSGAEYSTVYVGKTSAFDQYGSFAGLAETIDSGNADKTDNAFVMLDSTSSDESIISTISHETDHLLGTLDHGGSGLAQYACSSFNNTLTGVFNGSNATWYIDDVYFNGEHGYYLAGFTSCNASNCTSVGYHYNNISGAVLTNGTFGISAGHFVNSTTIGNGAHVTLALPVLHNSGTTSEYQTSASADTITISSGGVLNVFVNKATNITLYSSGAVAHGWTGLVLTHHGSDAAYISDFSSGAIVTGRIDNFNFNGDLNAVGTRLNNVTVGKEPAPNSGYFWGFLHMTSNAVASNTTVEGVMHVSSGTSAVNTTVTGGNLSTYAGAVIDTLTMSGGTAAYVSGAEIRGSSVVRGGTLRISSRTLNTPLSIAGSGIVSGVSNAEISGAQVSSGGLLGGSGRHQTYNTVVSSGGTQSVNYTAQAHNTTVSSGGSMLLYGIASNTIVDNGYMYASSNDAFDYDTVLRGANAVQHLVYATASRTHISSGALQSAGYGADVIDAVISSGGTQVLHGANNYYASAVNTIVNGVQSAVSNARVSNTSVFNSQYLGSNTSAINNHIIGGTLTAASGAYVNSLYVSNGGKALLDSTVSAVNGEIFSGGLISNGYFANLLIHSGGHLKNGAPTAYRGGTLSMEGGASATDISFDRESELNIAVTTNTLLLATDGNGSAYNISGGLYSDLTVSRNYNIEICSGARAENATVLASGTLTTLSGGSAVSCTISSGAKIYISGGETDNASIKNYGNVYIFDGGAANNTFVERQGYLNISSGGVANQTEILQGGYIYIYNGGIANSTTFNSGGAMYISSGGTANRTTMSGGSMRISSGGVANNTTVDSRGYIYIYSGGVHRGGLQTAYGAVVSAYTGAEVDFTLVGRTASDGYLINNIALVKGAPSYTITVSATQANGTYKLAQGAANFNKTLTIGDGTVDYGSITVNGDDLVYNGITYSLDKADGNLTLTVSGATSGISDLQASATGASWSGNAETVEYSQDNFATSLKLNTSGTAIDTFQTPAGAWQVRVDAAAQTGFTAASPGTTPAQLVSDADGNLDVFFAKTNTTWQGKNIAKHAGNLNGWTGTHERASISGKNKIEDIFAGSTDANVLVLTDDTNGDALFLDDIYSTFGNQARLSQIDEIRAGAGDDVVDLTSPKFAYVGDSMTVYGGSGNDTIWANSGSNTLYGDAGNDRLVGGNGNDFIMGGSGNDSMHGGGGNDTFCFGGNWGTDTIEQLASGKVILRFESGSLANWNASTQTYTSGSNTVTVTGTNDIELYFGADSTLPAGAFLSASSEKIYESINSGMLA